MHKDLDVWKNSVSFVTHIYSVTKNFPHEELYGLTNQIRRAAVSIASNIAEGAGRRSTKEFIKFLSIALGSISELETQLFIANNLEYLDQQKHSELQSELDSIRRMVIGLIKNLERKLNK